MERREFLRKSALAGVGFALGTGRTLGWGRALAQDLSRSPSEVETSKCLWGAFAMPAGQQKPIDALLALENLVGGQMAIHRDYQGMDADIRSKTAVWLSQRGPIPYRSFHA